MNKTINPGRVSGTLSVPSSKSQTIRALIIASLADGTSYIKNPLRSEDTLSCLRACRAMGAVVTEGEHLWEVRGISPAGSPQQEPLIIDTGNSGTTLYLGAGIAASLGRDVILTGDHQIRNRPAGPLAASLQDLGAQVTFEIPEELGLEPALAPGCPPFMIRGPLTGGRTTIACPTSQYLSSLLLAAPLALQDTVITVPLLNERPYVEMTLAWLAEEHITCTAGDDDVFTVTGRQTYSAFDKTISGDFSSASFFLCAAAITGSTLTLTGLDPQDTQGDKDIIHALQLMGCEINWEGDSLTVIGPEGGLTGELALDLNPIPDTLPVLAAASCFTVGMVRLENVPQARIKETDRIAVMCSELTRLGADIEETEDGLIIHGTGGLAGGTVDGHGDHRVIMACAIAALGCRGPVTIEGTDAVDITCPGFFDLLASIRTT
ncbi:MAG: 3-phosphoshikimate 1-carboxyvinyltransferase [Spirochaetia bacterium]|nr:3-phosphoshikimate 1-carboxyvinyltransferase [Spirochaetia bacterium]